MFKGFDVPGNRANGTFGRLRSFLTDALPHEAMPQVLSAIKTLQQVTHLRNAGQHAGAVRQAALALPALGLTFPIVDHQVAWWIVQVHVVNALDTIRTEIHSTTMHRSYSGPIRGSNRGRWQGRRPARISRGG
jgi:hypothetical protein